MGKLTGIFLLAATAALAQYTPPGGGLKLDASGNLVVGTTVLVTCGGVDDTAAINMKLAIPFSRVQLIASAGGNCAISSHLLIYSNTWLDLGTATITVPSGYADALLVNYASQNPNRTCADGAITAAGVTLTSPSCANFTAADVGQAIVLKTAGTPQTVTGSMPLPNPTHPDLYAHITAVTNSTTATIDFAASNTAAATLLIYRKDTNIKVSGGVWAKGNGPGGSGSLQNLLQFRRVDGVTITDTAISSDTQAAGGKYAIFFADVQHGNIQRVRFATISDGVHIDGPSSDIGIRDLSGITGDDLISLTNRDWANLDDDALGEIYGNISNVLIDGVRGSSYSTCSVLRIEGAVGTTIRNITARNIYPATPSGGIIFSDSAFFGGADISGVLIDGFGGDIVPTARNTSMIVLWATTIGDLTITNVSARLTTEPIILDVGSQAPAGSTIGNLHLRGFDVSGNASFGSQFYVSSNYTIGSLAADDIRVKWNYPGNQTPGGQPLTIFRADAPTTTISLSRIVLTVVAGGGGSVFTSPTGAVSSLIADGVQATYGTVNAGVLFSIGTSVSSWILDNIWAHNPNSIMNHPTGAIAGQGQISNSWQDSGRIADLTGSGTLNLIVNNATNLNPSAGLIYTNGVAVNVFGAGLICPSCSFGIARAGSEVLHVRNQDWKVDVSLLTRAMGDRAYNTNAALGTLGAAGPVISDATAWHLMTDPTKVY